MPNISDNHPIQPHQPESSKPSKSIEPAKVQYKGHDVLPHKKEASKIPTPPPLPTSDKPAIDKTKVKSTPQDPTKQTKQENVINRLKSAALASPKTASPLERQLVQGRDTQKLNQISKQIKSAAGSASKNLGLQPLGKGSQNPVSKIGGPQYVARAAVEDNIKSNKLDYAAAGNQMMGCFRELASPYFKEKIKALILDYQKVNQGDEKSVESGIKKVIDSLKGLDDEFNNDDLFFRDRGRFPATSGQLRDLITKLDDQMHPPTLENSSSYVQKDAVLSELRLMMSAAPESKKEAILKAIETIKQEEGQYIDKKNVDQLEVTVPHLTSYISTSEFIAQNDSKASALELVQNAIKSTGIIGTEFVFKTGAENTRELLGGKLLASLGLAKALVPKTEIELSGAKLGAQENPEGIASEFVAGSTIYSMNEWKELMQAKKQAAVAEFKLPDLQRELDQLTAENNPENQTKIEDLKNEIAEHYENVAKYENAKENVMKLGGTESIADHALSDALLCSYDSHIMQYLVKDGEVVNIDFARFLAPNEAFTKGEGDNKSVFLTLRSTWVDHPVTAEPLSAKHIETILNWDMDKIEKQWRQDGLIGNTADFDKASTKINDFRIDRQNLGYASEEELQALCDKYGLVKGSEMQMKKTIASHLKTEFGNVQKECFEKIHPKAFEEYKSRSIALQNYVKECQANQTTPNLADAFPKMYPKLAPFMKVMERLDENPGVSISFTTSGGSLQQRSLGSIISEAESKKLATSEEIAQMKEALAFYLNNVPDEASLATSMDL